LEGITADDRNVWVTDEDHALLVHIDARTNRVVGSAPTTGDVGVGTAIVDGDSAWAQVSNTGDVVRISARSNKVTEVVHVRDAPVWPIAIADGALWVASFDPNAPADAAAQLHRIDRKHGKVTKTISGVSSGVGTAVGGDLWVGGCYAYTPTPLPTAGCRVMRRIDGRTGAVKAEVPFGATLFSASPAGDNAVAVLTIDAQRNFPIMQLTVIDTRSNAPVAVYDVPPSQYPGNLAYGYGSAWLTDWSANAVRRMQLEP